MTVRLMRYDDQIISSNSFVDWLGNVTGTCPAKRNAGLLNFWGGNGTSQMASIKASGQNHPPLCKFHLGQHGQIGSSTSENRTDRAQKRYRKKSRARCRRPVAN